MIIVPIDSNGYIIECWIMDAILQLYHGSQFKWCRKSEYQGKQPICHKSLRKLTLSHYVNIEYRSPQTLAAMDTGYIGRCKSNWH